MRRSRFLLTSMLTLLVGVPATARAQFTVYTSEAAWLAAVSNSGTDTFTGFSTTDATASPINRTAGAYGYTASATGYTFVGEGTADDPWLSTNFASDVITFNNFGPTVRAIGGNFFTSTFSGTYAPGDIMLSFVNAGGTSSHTIIGSTVGSFVGIVSTGGAISSFMVNSVQPSVGYLWPTVDNFSLAEAPSTTVPEPSTYVMVAAGLAALALRRRHQA